MDSFTICNAGVAQLVEHDLAKVGVAGSSLVSRSIFEKIRWQADFFCPGGGIGRHAGLKILFAVMQVRVQVPPRVQKSE